MSCHDNLYALICDYGGQRHLAYKDAGYGQTMTVNDCTPCHRARNIGGGPGFEDVMHVAHYSSSAFEGNCWSCHATLVTGDFVLFDEYVYSSEFGGYPKLGTTNMQKWIDAREGTGSTMAGVTCINDIKFDSIELDQRISSLEDLFCDVNSGIPEISIENYKLNVASGVNNPRSFTLDELKKLGEVTIACCEVCAGNGVDCTQVGNIECTGVRLSDVIAACGGLKDGVITLQTTSADNWFKGGLSDIDKDLEEGAILCWAFNGEPLSPEEGYPLRLVIPGWSGFQWSKYLTQIDFTSTDSGTHNWYDRVTPEGQTRYHNTLDAFNHAWWTPNSDGQVFKLGEPITLEGYVWVWAHGGHQTSAAAFSADYGNTWTTIDVPSDFDKNQWVYFTAKWTPKEAGTYTLYVKPIDSGGYDTQAPSAVILTVTE